MTRAAKAVRALLLIGLLPATVAAAYPHATAPPRHTGPVTSARRASAAGQAGYAVPSTPTFVLGAVVRNLVSFDHAVYHKATLRMMFLRWNTPLFPVGIVDKNAVNGAETVIELQPHGLTMVQIIKGEGDAWLTSVFAPGIAAANKPITVSFAPEMNGQWYAYGFRRTKPADYVAAWQHVHNVLAATAAGSLITWMWQPSAIHFTTPSPKPWWPGSQYVNEVGLDGYYVQPWDNFNVIFVQTIKLVRSLTNVPIMIGETSVGMTTLQPVVDIRDLFAGIRRYHLHGLVWFNIRQNRGIYHQDWRLQDHLRLLRAFRYQLAIAMASVP